MQNATSALNYKFRQDLSITWQRFNNPLSILNTYMIDFLQTTY